MLLYIIDGFNLVHKVPSLKQSDDPQPQLIQYLKEHKLTGSRNNKATVVFDGWARIQIPKEPGFEVIFGCDRSADDIIKERIAKIKKTSQYPLSEVIVVSDDREIRDFAKKLGAVSRGITDFLKINNSKSRSKEDSKEISYPLQKEITDELRRIWLEE